MPKKKLKKIAEDEPEEEVAFPEKKKNQIFVLVQNAQVNEAFHPKYVKEMQQIYKKMTHDSFFKLYLDCLQQLMAKDDTNHYANIGLKFLAKFATSYNIEDVHPVLRDSFNWTLGTISVQPVVRFRLCQFVNLLLNSLGAEAVLDDLICDNILKYMFDRMKDISSIVRVQATHALQRLQNPDNPTDPIVKIYQFHMSTDPSPLVRQAVISSIGRNFNTIPIILDRLWDIDDKVRRHTCLQMCSYPVRSYKVAHRLVFLEQGLIDHSDSVRRVVTDILLPQWFESYNKNYVSFLSCLKLDGNEIEINRFKKISKMALMALFRSQKIGKIIESMPLNTDEDMEFVKCIALDKLTVESCLCWSSLVEFLQQNANTADHVETILPDLSTLCNYVLKYCEMASTIDKDKWQKLEYQYVLLSLSEIFLTYDLADEIGRNKLKSLIAYLFTNEPIEENTVICLIKTIEKLITNQDERFQFIIDIIENVVGKNTSNSVIDLKDPSVQAILEKDTNLRVKVSSLKLRILELKEQETNSLEQKNYVKATKLTEELQLCNEQLSNLIRPFLETTSSSEDSSILQPKKITTETIVKCLQMAYYVVCSKMVKTLNPNICQLYKDFIRRQVESAQMLIRDWALKCCTTFSLYYDLLAKDVFRELHMEFFKHNNPIIWATSIRAMFQLIDRYGFEYFDEESEETGTEPMDKTKSKKTTSRQLYNTMEYLESEDDTSSQEKKTVGRVALMYLFQHFLVSCDDLSILSALIDGFCRLIVNSHYSETSMVSSLMLKYFDPTTDTKINQLLGIFFESLLKKKKQECLQEALIKTLFGIIEAPCESPLKEIKPETVIKFVVNSTSPKYCSPGLHLHDDIATSFVEVMLENATNKDLLKIISKELLTLQVSDNAKLKDEIKIELDKLLEMPLDLKTQHNIKSFKQILNGEFKGQLTFSSNRETVNNENGSDHGENEIVDASDNESENGDKENDEVNQDEATNEKLTVTVEVHAAEVVKSGPTAEINVNKPTEITAEDEIVPIPAEKPITPKSATKKNKNLSSDLVHPQPDLTPQQPAKKQRKNKDVPQSGSTFGIENTANIRYLRKSMNPRPKSAENSCDDLPSPPKVRNETPKKNKNEKTKVNKDKAEEKEKENSQEIDSDEDIIMGTPEPISSKIAAQMVKSKFTAAKKAEQKKSDDSFKQPTRPTRTNKRLFVPSPKNVRTKINEKEKRKSNITPTKSAEKPKSAKKPTANIEKNKLPTAKSPSSTASSSSGSSEKENLKKSGTDDKKATDEAPKRRSAARRQTNSSPNRTKNQILSPKKTITPKKYKTNSHLARLVNSENSHKTVTRRALAEEFINNNIITRKRISAVEPGGRPRTSLNVLDRSKSRSSITKDGSIDRKNGKEKNKKELKTIEKSKETEKNTIKKSNETEKAKELKTIEKSNETEKTDALKTREKSKEALKGSQEIKKTRKSLSNATESKDSKATSTTRAKSKEVPTRTASTRTRHKSNIPVLTARESRTRYRTK